jgi:hypothetical protein
MRWTHHVRVSACLSAVLLTPVVPAARADGPCPPAPVAGEPIPKSGFVREQSLGFATGFKIEWTDREGKKIDGGAVQGVTKFFGGNLYQSDPIRAPRSVATGGGRVIVCDFVQTTQPVPPAQRLQTTEPQANTGEMNVLSVEALVFDPVVGAFATANVFEAVAAHVGLGVWVPIPDLYADTNGDGTVGVGDILHSAVDLNVYLPSLPTFSLGQTFNIVNGLVPELPGMWFSSTPITFDPLTGAFTGTPITIEGAALSSHEVESVVPEPSTLILLGAGVLLAPVARRRRG